MVATRGKGKQSRKIMQEMPPPANWRRQKGERFIDLRRKKKKRGPSRWGENRGEAPVAKNQLSIRKLIGWGRVFRGTR